ncbi:hypothetical protein ACQKD9_27900 [Bacillus paramycoides]|uniref:hypothetical protein n=1 Tax=Bacillus paramycoides TaxID=2026194 RepID=UPI003D00C889
MAIVECGNCPEFDSDDVISFDCVNNTFLVKLLDVERDPVNNLTILTYELCQCGNINFNQFYFQLCPEGQGPQLNEDATKAANNPSGNANFVGIIGNQAQNPFDRAALFTSANEQCQEAVLVYNGIFIDSQIQVGQNAVAGRKGQNILFASVAGLFDCAQEPECDTCPQDCTATQTVLVPLMPGCCQALTPPPMETIGESALCFGTISCKSGPSCQQTATIVLCGNEIECCVDIPTMLITSNLSITVSFPYKDECGRTVSQCQNIPVTLINTCPVCSGTECLDFNPCNYEIGLPEIVLGEDDVPAIRLTVSASCADLLG